MLNKVIRPLYLQYVYTHIQYTYSTCVTLIWGACGSCFGETKFCACFFAVCVVLTRVNTGMRKFCGPTFKFWSYHNISKFPWQSIHIDLNLPPDTEVFFAREPDHSPSFNYRNAEMPHFRNSVALHADYSGPFFQYEHKCTFIAWCM